MIPFDDPAAENSANADPVIETCASCGSALQGPYCGECGQRNAELKRPLLGFLSDTLSEFFAVDSRLGRTLKTLVLKPGRVAREFADGRRSQFVPPLRLFLFGLFASLAVSAILDFSFEDEVSTSESRLSSARYQIALVREETTDPMLGSQLEHVENELAKLVDDAEVEPADETTVEALDDPEVDHLDDGHLRVDITGDDAVDEYIKKLVRQARAEPKRFAERLGAWTERILTAMAFLAALIFAILFRRRFLIEHFVFSLYLHGALLLGSALFAPFSYTSIEPITVPVFFFGVLAYVPISMRGFYGGGRLGIAVRVAVSGVLYGVVALTLLLSALAWEAWQLAG